MLYQLSYAGTGADRVRIVPDLRAERMCRQDRPADGRALGQSVGDVER